MTSENELKEKAVSLLKDGTVTKVLGWKKGLFENDVTPYVFSSVSEIENDFVYNGYCASNLCKYLVPTVTHPNGINPYIQNEDGTKTYPKTLVFLKEKDKLGYNLLIKEKRINPENIVVIDIDFEAAPKNGPAPLTVADIEKLSTDERFDFWQKELSRCIRCNACRDICPACTCEKCIFDNTKSEISQKVASDNFEENLYHIIRAWHVAGRCVGCGECGRVCPEHIPLHLINGKMIKEINENFGSFQSGADTETKAPMLTFTKEDPEV